MPWGDEGLSIWLVSSQTVTLLPLEAQTEVEALRKEIECLRKKVQEAEKVKGLPDIPQESRR